MSFFQCWNKKSVLQDYNMANKVDVFSNTGNSDLPAGSGPKVLRREGIECT